MKEDVDLVEGKSSFMDDPRKFRDDLATKAKEI